MSDDDGFVFGDDEDESLFGSSDTLENDSERRFGTSAESDSSSTIPSLDRTIGTIEVAVLAAVLVVLAGAMAYPLVMGSFDTGGPTDGDAPSDGGSAGVSTPATPTEPPVTEIVMTAEETTTGRVDPTNRPTSVTQTESSRVGTSSTTASPTTGRATVPVNAFPAGDSSAENETVEP